MPTSRIILKEIPELYDLIIEEKYDLVSGWKKKRYDSVITKNIPSKLFNWAARKTSGVKLHDFNCGLKAFRKEVVKSIEVSGEMHRYIPVLAKSAGFSRIGEKVVKHQARKYGKTKFGMERFINGFSGSYYHLVCLKIWEKTHAPFWSFRCVNVSHWLWLFSLFRDRQTFYQSNGKINY